MKAVEREMNARANFYNKLIDILFSFLLIIDYDAAVLLRQISISIAEKVKGDEFLVYKKSSTDTIKLIFACLMHQQS